MGGDSFRLSSCLVALVASRIYSDQSGEPAIGWSLISIRRQYVLYHTIRSHAECPGSGSPIVGAPWSAASAAGVKFFFIATAKAERLLIAAE